jgi:hypothetical protein
MAVSLLFAAVCSLLGVVGVTTLDYNLPVTTCEERFLEKSDVFLSFFCLCFMEFGALGEC